MSNGELILEIERALEELDRVVLAVSFVRRPALNLQQRLCRLLEGLEPPERPAKRTNRAPARKIAETRPALERRSMSPKRR